MNVTLIISGKRKKQVKGRIKEHQNNIRIGEQNSMIFQHVANYNHNMDFSNPTVLAKNQHPRGRRILETFYSQNSTRASYKEVHGSSWCIFSCC